MTQAMLQVTGHNEIAKAFLDAREAGRLHHAWILEGPKGIGKARLALNLAAVMLGAEYHLSDEGFSVRQSGIAENILVGSHPDFRVIDMTFEEGAKRKTSIPVEDIRRLSTFFSLKPGMGGYRIAIIDAVDDLNQNGANALLKTLEEPPSNCLIFLIFHKTTGLLPTIRSRCQRLSFGTLKAEDVRSILGLSDLTPQQAEILEVCGGSPGQFSEYLDAGVEDLLRQLKTAFGPEWPRPKASTLNRLLQHMTKTEAHFRFTLNYLDHILPDLSLACSEGQRHKLAKAWIDIRTEAGIGTAYQLDIAERSAKCLSTLQDTLRTLVPSDAV